MHCRRESLGQQQLQESGMTQHDKPTVGRRDVLRGAFRAVAAGAGAAVATAAPVATTAVAAESDQEKRKPRYWESEHVKTYYRVNRY
jgi:hypothetical protein